MDDARGAVVLVVVDGVVIPLVRVAEETPGLDALQAEPGFETLPDLEEHVEERGRLQGHGGVPHPLPVQGFLLRGEGALGDVGLHRVPVVGDVVGGLLAVLVRVYAVRAGGQASSSLRGRGEAEPEEKEGKEYAEGLLHQKGCSSKL